MSTPSTVAAGYARPVPAQAVSEIDRLDLDCAEERTEQARCDWRLLDAHVRLPVPTS